MNISKETSIDPSGEHIDTAPSAPTNPYIDIQTNKINRMNISKETSIDPSGEHIDTAPKAPTNPYIDNITLELFMNKNHYNRYFSKHNPKKFAERREQRVNIEKNRDRILEITNILLDNPDTKISNRVNEIFIEYTKAIIEHIR